MVKTNFIFEWVLENGLEMLSTDDDIEAIYTKIDNTTWKGGVTTWQPMT